MGNWGNDGIREKETKGRGDLVKKRWGCWKNGIIKTGRLEGNNKKTKGPGDEETERKKVAVEKVKVEIK